VGSSKACYGDSFTFFTFINLLLCDVIRNVFVGVEAPVLLSDSQQQELVFSRFQQSEQQQS
jgi:hypothetical protein